MATATVTSFSLRFFSPSLPSNKNYFNGAVRLSSFSKGTISPLKLSFNQSISSGFPSIVSVNKVVVVPSKRPSVTVFAAKGYKMKTHKASAKRFRVTGNGKIVRRRAGKQHLLYKKNTKRRNRLSKMVTVNRSDYDNVISCLPYLKVNRKAK